MFRQLINWRTGLALIAICIVVATIFYSRYVSRKIAKEEMARVSAFGESLKIKAITEDQNVLEYTNRIVRENQDIPIIETDEKDNPSGQWVNLDTLKTKDSGYLRRMVKHVSVRPPVIVEITKEPYTYNKYYYGDSKLLNEVRYYPLIQLGIVALFIFLTIFSIRSSYRSAQNQVWAGMAKETAHQLGTPVSSLEGWIEMLKEKPGNEKIVQELEKDVDRLRLVSDRFGKIGSTPQLEEIDLVSQINTMVDYMRKRATGKINFSVNTHGQKQVIAKVSAPLFDWVIENLLKNSLDALEGRGAIIVDIQEEKNLVNIDITDSGKGISRQNIPMV